MKKIICFGDSNTYGYNPATGGRFDENTRWPKVLQKLLGEDYEIFEEGQNGRNISDPDPWEGGTKCGMDYVLPMIETRHPADLLIIMLGTNDLKLKFHLPPADIAGSLQLMLSKIKAYCRGDQYDDNPWHARCASVFHGILQILVRQQIFYCQYYSQGLFVFL